MVSEVDICNRGLVKVHAPLITSLTQDSPEAILCNAVYDQIRDEVLRDHFWNFAIKQANLEQLAETPVFEFDYKYALPADYIRIYRLENQNQRYKIKSGELHTNQSTMKIEYVARITDTTKFDPMFTTALCLRIAAELAYPVAGSNDRYRELLAEYNQYIKMAKRVDGQEGTPDSLTADLFVDSRHEYGGSYPVDWTR